MACNVETVAASLDQMTRNAFLSFLIYHQIFKAIQLQLFQYDTFCQHARMFTEPAVMNKWKISQDVMLQQPSEEDKVIVGGDMRADFPSIYILFKLYSSDRRVILYESDREGAIKNICHTLQSISSIIPYKE